MSLQNGKCDRCGERARSLRMSMFNTEMLCHVCIKREKNHPLYREAKRRVREEDLNGNPNFEGIGKPDDL